MKYRKKPVVIEALQWNGQNKSEISEFTRGIASFKKSLVYIKTLEGTMTAKIDDYIVKGVHGEFYPCKPNIFQKTYDLI